MAGDFAFILVSVQSAGRGLAKPSARHYNRGRIAMPLPLTPERCLTLPTHDHSLLEQVTMLWLESAALRAG